MLHSIRNPQSAIRNPVTRVAYGGDRVYMIKYGLCTK
jgi:hypothetical protein